MFFRTDTWVICVAVPCMEKLINKCTKWSWWCLFPHNCSSSTQLIKLLFGKLFKPEISGSCMIPLSPASRCLSLIVHHIYSFSKSCWFYLQKISQILHPLCHYLYPRPDHCAHLPTSLLAPYNSYNKLSDIKNQVFPCINLSKSFQLWLGWNPKTILRPMKP